MNSRVAISGLDRPLTASPATWASWEVNAAPAWVALTMGLALVSPAAVSSRRARSANPSIPISSSIS